MQRSFRLAFLLLALAALPALAGGDAKVRRMLEKLEPTTRMFQLCDLALMEAADGTKGGADLADVAALAEPKVKGDTLAGEGGAVRIGGRWYRASFVCKLAPDHMSVISFQHHLKAEIDKQEQQDHNLAG